MGRKSLKRKSFRKKSIRRKSLKRKSLRKIKIGGADNHIDKVEAKKVPDEKFKEIMNNININKKSKETILEEMNKFITEKNKYSNVSMAPNSGRIYEKYYYINDSTQFYNGRGLFLPKLQFLKNKNNKNVDYNNLFYDLLYTNYDSKLWNGNSDVPNPNIIFDHTNYEKSSIKKHARAKAGKPGLHIYVSCNYDLTDVKIEYIVLNEIMTHSNNHTIKNIKLN